MLVCILSERVQRACVSPLILASHQLFSMITLKRWKSKKKERWWKQKWKKKECIIAIRRDFFDSVANLYLDCISARQTFLDEKYLQSCGTLKKSKKSTYKSIGLTSEPERKERLRLGYKCYGSLKFQSRSSKFGRF